MSILAKKNEEEKKKTTADEDKPKRFVRSRRGWMPKTDIGVAIKEGFGTVFDAFKNSIKFREPDVADYVFGKELKEEVICVKSVQKQTKAGQKTKMKAICAVGNQKGIVGCASKTATDVATAIRGAIARAKMSLQPVQLGYWGNKIGNVHTVRTKATGKAGTVKMRVIPAPKGTGVKASLASRKIFNLAGVEDVFTRTDGRTCTTGNMVKATMAALDNSTHFFTPENWENLPEKPNILTKFSTKIKAARKNYKNN